MVEVEGVQSKVNLANVCARAEVWPLRSDDDTINKGILSGLHDPFVDGLFDLRRQYVDRRVGDHNDRNPIIDFERCQQRRLQQSPVVGG